MKRFVFTAILTAALASTALAQRGGGGGGNRNNMGGDMGPQVRPAPPSRLDLLTQFLNLSKDQRKDVKNIMDEGRKQAAPLREQMAKSRAEMAAAVEGGKAEEIDRAVKSYAGLETKMAEIELKSFAQIFKLLDNDQQSKTRAVFTMMAGIFQGKNWTETEQ